MRLFLCLCYIILPFCFGLPEVLKNYECEGPSLQPHPFECRSFVLCIEIERSVFIPAATYHCPPNFAFSPQLNFCVPDSQIPTCPQETSMVKSKRRRRQAISCTASGVTCSGCNTLVICVGTSGTGFSPLFTLNCATLSASAPFCNPTLGTCSSTTTDPSCQPTTTSVTTPTTTVPTTQPTTVSTTQPTTVSTTQPTTVSTTQPTTVSTTQPTTVSTTQPTTVSTTQPTTVSTTQPTTVSTTQPTTVSTTQPTTVRTTQSTTIATTVAPFQCTTVGTFTDPLAVNCTSYYKCNNVNGVLTPVKIYCLQYMQYNPQYSICVNSPYANCTYTASGKK